MSGYNLNTTVSKQEAEALKDLIFKRARERAKAMNDEIQTSYTESMQTEVMDMARDSFHSTQNPFSTIQATEPSTPAKSTEEQVGFEQKNIDEIKLSIQNRQKTLNADIAHKETELAMIEARNTLHTKQSFYGALEFLNSQATITLVKKKAQSFEAMA